MIAFFDMLSFCDCYIYGLGDNKTICLSPYRFMSNLYVVSLCYLLLVFSVVTTITLMFQHLQ